MANFVFDDIVLPSGTLKITLINDAVDTATYYLTGNWILNIAQLNRIVEENGIGGVLKIADLDLEIYDRGGRLKDEVLLKGTITSVQAKILLEVNSVEYPVLYGDVDLHTVEYPSYYDDEASEEAHYCKFVVFSFLKRLEEKSLVDLREALSADAVTYTTLNSIDTFTFQNPASMESDSSLPVSGQAWTNAILGSISDDGRATCALTYNQFTRYLKATSFVDEYGEAINIESTQTIDGIEFQIEWSKSVLSTGTIKDSSIKAIKAGVISGNENANGTYLTTSDVFDSYGSDTDLWGLSWTPSDINTSTFGVAISVICDSIGLSGTAQVDSVKCIITTHDTDAAREFVLVSKVIDRIQEQLDVTVAASTATIGQLFEAGTTQTNYLGLYFPYKLSSGEYSNFWNDTKTGSFMTLKDCKSLLMVIAGHLLAYPVLRYTVSTDTFQIYLKQRGAGTTFVSADLGILKKSSNKSFYGYDAIRCRSAVTGTSHISPSNITDDQFELIKQSFDYPVYWGTFQGETGAADGNPGQGLYLLVSGSNMRRINRVIDGATTYIRWRQWLLARFVAYWSNPDMWERTYKGTSFEVGIEDLDQITVNGDDYTITEITDNLTDNEMTAKMVQYS